MSLLIPMKEKPRVQKFHLILRKPLQKLFFKYIYSLFNRLLTEYSSFSEVITGGKPAV